MIIGRTWALTAKHVLPVVEADKIGQVLKVIAHPTLDLALVQIAELKGTVKFARRMPRFGDKLNAIGWHLGAEKLWTEGRAGRFGKMSCEVMPGCSGGAVFNDQNELVGIIKNVYMQAVIDRMMGRRTQFGTHVPHMAGYTPITKDVRTWIRESLKEYYEEARKNRR